MKLLKLIFTAFLIMVIVAIVAFHLLLNSSIKKGIEILGPKVTQTDITLEKVKVSPFSGYCEIRGLVIGNPEGFKTPSAFQLARVRIDLNVKSLFSNQIRINEIIINNPQVTYEVSLRNSNIKQIKENMEAISNKLPRKNSENSDSKSTESQKVEISRFMFEDGNVQLSAQFLQGNAISIPIPPVSLTDIGKGGDGITVAEAMQKILIAISDAVLEAVLRSGKIGEIFGASLKNNGESGKKNSSKVVGELKKIFGKENE